MVEWHVRMCVYTYVRMSVCMSSEPSRSPPLLLSSILPNNTRQRLPGFYVFVSVYNRLCVYVFLCVFQSFIEAAIFSRSLFLVSFSFLPPSSLPLSSLSHLPLRQPTNVGTRKVPDQPYWRRPVTRGARAVRGGYRMLMA